VLDSERWSVPGIFATMRPAIVLSLAALLLASCAAPEPTKVRLAGASPSSGPYSPGVDLGDLVFLAGQIGVEPSTRQLVTGGIEAETHQVMANLGALLAEAGLGYGDVVKTSVFLADVADFDTMNRIYRSYFPSDAILPARTTVQVAAIPRGARVEIDFIAARR
jgi:2-iminobutanoate/2-iminopropanoate deaminase